MNTAVILTARKERDSQIPYPLLPIDGKRCLIDRTLQLLRELHYERIILVVGYCHEMFQRFAAPRCNIGLQCRIRNHSLYGFFSLSQRPD